MKKFYSTLQKENVQMAIVIISVFLITGIVALYAIYN